MGIREYFKEQLSEDDLKMQNLDIETREVKDELVFDPEKELSEEYWLWLDNDLQNKFEMMQTDEGEIVRRLPAWLSNVADYKIISSERFERFMESKQDVVWKLGKDYLLELGLSIFKFLELAADLRCLFPDRFSELDFDMDDILGKVDSLVITSNRHNVDFAAGQNLLLANFKIAFPNYFDQLALSETEVEEKVVNTLPSEWNNIYVDNFRCVRILFLNRKDKYSLSDKKWGQMKKELVNTSKWLISAMAASMKILAADEVRVTRNGLEVVMKDKKVFKQDKKRKPVRRSF